MTFRDYFFSEALVGEPFWLKHLGSGDKVKVQRVTGTPAFYGWEGNNEHAAIDVGIAPIIDMLNQKGYKTWVSCSGLPEDHKPKEHTSLSNMIIGAYIGFDPKDYNVLRPIFIAAGFKEVGNRSAHVYPKSLLHLRNIWKKFFELVKRLPSK